MCSDSNVVQLFFLPAEHYFPLTQNKEYLALSVIKSPGLYDIFPLVLSSTRLQRRTRSIYKKKKKKKKKVTVAQRDYFNSHFPATITNSNLVSLVTPGGEKPSNKPQFFSSV